MQNGTITLSYDEQAIKDYLAAELPKQLNQEKVCLLYTSSRIGRLPAIWQSWRRP